MSRFASAAGGPRAARREFKEMVKRLHKAGIEVREWGEGRGERGVREVNEERNVLVGAQRQTALVKSLGTAGIGVREREGESGEKSGRGRPTVRVGGAQSLCLASDERNLKAMAERRNCIILEVLCSPASHEIVTLFAQHTTESLHRIPSEPCTGPHEELQPSWAMHQSTVLEGGTQNSEP